MNKNSDRNVNTIYKCGLGVGILVIKDSENLEDLIFVDHEGLPATNPNLDSKETNDPLSQSHRLSFQIPS